MKTNRNDPCPCGSGKKYKKCCLAETFVKTGKEESIRKRLVDELLKFYNKNYRNTIEEAHELFWDDFDPQEYFEGDSLDIAYQNFFEWIVFDFIIDPDTYDTLIDLYMEQNKKLNQDEHKILTIMKNSCISLYEVQEVFPEKGLLLKDLLMGGEYDVNEKAATRSLKRWDIFATRLLLIDGQYIMSGAVYPYSIIMKQQIVDDIMDEYREFQEEFPDDTLDTFLKESGDIFNFHWYYAIQNSPSMKTIEANQDETRMPPENDVPMELQKKVYSQYMQDHYEKWFSDKIPALDNKTPMEAMKTEEGKKKVIELLKLYENGEELNKRDGRPHYDLSWVWEKLGIEKE